MGKQKLILDRNNVYRDPGELARELRSDPQIRQYQALNFRVVMTYFQRCQKSPDLFTRDPFLIERKYHELQLLVPYFTHREWPEFYAVLDEMEKIVKDTQSVRESIYYSTLSLANVVEPTC